MKMLYPVTLLLILLFAKYSLNIRLEVDYWTDCEGNDGAFVLNVTTGYDNGSQYLNFQFNVHRPFGADSPATVVVDKDLNGRWIRLFTVKVRNFCTLMYRYYKSIVYDMQKKAGVQTGACPFPSGNFNVLHYKPDMKALLLFHIPKGKYFYHAETNWMGRKDVCFNCQFRNID